MEPDYDMIAARTTWIYSAFRDLSRQEQDEELRFIRRNGGARVASFLAELRDTAEVQDLPCARA